MFYYVGCSLSNKNRYVYKNVSFKGYNKKTCDNCGRDITTTMYDDGAYKLLVEGGSIYPDLLRFCGAGDQMFLLSEKALSVFVKENISGIESYDLVKIANEESNTTQYYCVKLSGHIDLNYSSMFLKKKKKCDICGKFELNRKRIHPFIVNKSTWNGCDICYLETFPAVTICTEKIVRIVRKYKLKGFKFEELKEN